VKKSKLFAIIVTIIPILYIFSLPLSYISVRLSDRLLRVSYSPDGFQTVVIMAFSISAISLVLGLFLSLISVRRGTWTWIYAIVFSSVGVIVCTIVSFLIYVQCDTLGIEYLLTLEGSVITKNIQRSVITAIIPCQVIFWGWLVLFLQIKKDNRRVSA